MPSVRYSSAMATIQVRDVPEDVAETYRRRAQASGKSLQSYMREQLIAMAQRRDKAEVMAIVERALERDTGPGLSDDTIRSGLWELRGERVRRRRDRWGKRAGSQGRCRHRGPQADCRGDLSCSASH